MDLANGSFHRQKAGCLISLCRYLAPAVCVLGLVEEDGKKKLLPCEAITQIGCLDFPVPVAIRLSADGPIFTPPGGEQIQEDGRQSLGSGANYAWQTVKTYLRVAETHYHEASTVYPPSWVSIL